MVKRIVVALALCFSCSSLWSMHPITKAMHYLNALIAYLQTGYYQSQLDDAIQLGNCAYVQKLLACDIDINEPYGEDGTPLHKAAAFGEDAIIKVLLIAGARVDARDEDGKTALEIAHERNNHESAELIKSYAANPVRTLKELCMNVVRRRRYAYQDKLNSLPKDLQEEL
jgi:ankyrin repeat protein